MKQPGLSRHNLVTALIAVAALAALLYVLVPTPGSDQSAEDRPSARLALEREAPVFEATDTSGARISLADYRGQTVLVNFWASWCGPCVKEMPLIEEAYRTQDTQFQLISVNVGEARGTVNEFIADTGVTFPVILDAVGRISDLYRVVGLPATFVINPEGNLSYAASGEITDQEQLRTILRSGSGKEAKS